MNFSSQVSIVGGGIGGLATALALAQRGIPVMLFEQNPAFGEVGAGIQLSPNACSVLAALGLLEPVQACAVMPEQLIIRRHNNLQPLACLPLQHAPDNLPYLHIHRADLIAVLAAAVTASPLIQIQQGKRVERIEHLANGVALFTAQGERFASHWLVGADGIHSMVQPLIGRAEQPRFTGQTAWRALVPKADIPAALIPQPGTHLWLGPQAHVVMYYVRGSQLLNVVAVTEQADWHEESWTCAAPPEELLLPFLSWHPALQDILRCIPAAQCFRWGLFDRHPFAPWFNQRLLVLGDAAHPTLPFLAQGAALALEDAWEFARLLGRYPQTAGERFFVERFTRTTALQQRARRQAKIYHAHWLPLVASRNLLLSAGSRIAPQYLNRRLTQHFEWRAHE